VRSWEGLAVTIAPSLLEDTYMQLRVCGQRRRECHLFWLASWRDARRITRIVHPKHTASSVSVEIDSEWLNSFFLELADASECIRVQVHSHPGSAFHSTTDDTWPAVRTRGYLSLVIPNFAAGEPHLGGAYLAEQTSSGGWITADVTERIKVDEVSPAVDLAR
jgi:hypothetical protein